MTKQNKNITIIDAIYKRRSIRSYEDKHIDDDIIYNLLDAAIYAPTAMHQEALIFAVIQDKNLLKRISDIAKNNLAKERQNPESPFHDKSLDHFTDPKFNIFYNSDALVIIYGTSDKPFIVADCWLAAENLMLAAYNIGVGSCVIGLAVEVLNSKELKDELKVPDTLTAFAPIILGYPKVEISSGSRKKPEIIFKK